MCTFLYIQAKKKERRDLSFSDLFGDSVFTSKKV
jgi:hypothetical protein